MTVQIGQMITDGTAVFYIDDVTDGRKTGDIIFHHVLRPGYIKANGAALAVEDYPRLLKYVQDNSLSVTEAEWQAGKSGMYVYDETAGTLRVPDLRGEFMRGLDDGRGVDVGRILGMSQEDAIRNISGSLSYVVFEALGTSGAFTITPYSGNSHQDANDGRWGSAIFNAGNVVPTAAENRPHNIALIPQIKY